MYLPPPARVSVIAPTSPEARTFLHWLEAEDPPLSSQTQRPVEARPYQLPKLAHVPSYIAVPPRLDIRGLILMALGMPLRSTMLYFSSVFSYSCFAARYSASESRFCLPARRPDSKRL